MSARPVDLLAVRYSCPLCGLKQVTCNVPARGPEGVVAWTEQMIAHVSADHARRSPACHPKQLHDIMVPVIGTDRIGEAPVQ